jgi:DNA polymerase V
MFTGEEIMLLDLRQQGEFTDDLFAEVQPAAAEKVMSVLDQINNRWVGARCTPRGYR